MTHPLAALLKDVPRYQTLSGNMLPEAAVLAALSAAHHVNETPKTEHDGADVLSATPPDLVEAAIAELQDVMRCRCDKAFTDRGMRDPDCQCDSQDALDTLIALVTAQAAQIAGLEAKARESAMQELASLGQAQEAYEAQVAAETALAAERAKVARLVEALKPFAEYMADGGDKNYEGDLLPDTEGVGWVYLTVGDFRRARAALSEAEDRDE